VGLWQKQGYVKGFYGSGADRYTELGVDDEGLVYVPLYPARINETTQVRKTPNWPRSWANFSLFYLYSHRHA
jgi:hypothetical protein